MDTVVSVTLDQLIKDSTLIETASINDLVEAYNKAVVILDRPNDKVNQFGSPEQARTKMNGVVVEINAERQIARTKREAGAGKKVAPVRAKKADGVKAKPAAKKAAAPKVAKKEGKTAAAKPAPKRAPKATEPPTHVGNVPVADVLAAFKAREGTFRANVLKRFVQSQGKQVKAAALMDAGWGKEGTSPKLAMCLRGANLSIKKGKLPYAIHSSSDNDGATYGLYAIRKA